MKRVEFDPFKWFSTCLILYLNLNLCKSVLSFRTVCLSVFLPLTAGPSVCAWGWYWKPHGSDCSPHSYWWPPQCGIYSPQTSRTLCPLGRKRDMIRISDVFQRSEQLHAYIHNYFCSKKKNAREKTKQEDVLNMASKNKADTMLMKYGYYKVICL